jgi:pyruvate,water dikinase
MLPFVRTIDETRQVLRILKSEGLARSRDFKVWLMAEVPSIIILGDKFADVCDGFSIGSNDLTQLTLGVDRDSERLGKMGYFDERNLAVLESIKRLIRLAHEKGKTVSICGQAPSTYPEVTEFLVRNGVDSISVNPDVVYKTKQLISSVEKKILLEAARHEVKDEAEIVTPVEREPEVEQTFDNSSSYSEEEDDNPGEQVEKSFWP